MNESDDELDSLQLYGACLVEPYVYEPLATGSRPGRSTEQRTDPDRTDPPSDDGESDESDVDVSMELQAEKTADGASGIDGGDVSTGYAW